MTVLNNAPMHIAQLYNLVALDSTDTFYSTFHVLLVLLSNVTLVVYCVLAHLSTYCSFSAKIRPSE